MTKEIQKLAEQAGIEFDDDFPLEPETIYYLKLSDFEKFAELIVKECARMIPNTDLDDVDGGDSSVLFAAASQLRKHFGLDK